MNTGYWTIERIESLGLKLISNEKLWCHFRGCDFDIFINLNIDQVKGNHFNFRAYKNSFKGNFKAELNTEEEFKQLMKFIK